LIGWPANNYQGFVKGAPMPTLPTILVIDDEVNSL